MGEVVKVVRRGKFVGYYLRYYDATGRRVMRTAGTASHAEALRKLREVEGAEATAARTGQPVPRPAAPITVAELCDRFLASSHYHVRDPDNYRRKSRYGLSPVLPLLGHIELHILKRRDIERARDVLAKRYAPNSVRSYLRPLGAALRWAVNEELITQSPMAGLRQPKRTQSVDRLSREEAQALLQSANGAMKLAIGLALRQGLRYGEVFGLRWCDVDFARRRLTVAQQQGGKLPKNGKPRTLPLQDEMAAELTAWRQLHQPQPGALVCTVSRRQATRIEALLDSVTGRRFVRPWHTLRHTFASLFIEAGGSIVALKELLGHSSLEMSLIYSHISPAALAADMAKLKL